jgi:hypothetical protein
MVNALDCRATVINILDSYFPEILFIILVLISVLLKGGSCLLLAFGLARLTGTKVLFSRSINWLLLHSLTMENHDRIKV